MEITVEVQADLLIVDCYHRRMRHFPPPWSIEEDTESFTVKDANGQSYQNRYCAFVDILAFRQLVAEQGVDDLHRILATLHSPFSMGGELVSDDDLRQDFHAQSISDAVAVSVLPTPTGLRVLFQSLKVLSVELLSKGYFARGAIVKGRLYHDEKMIFGEALHAAYDLECTVVTYPRIMIRSDVVSEARQTPALKEYLVQAEDGPFFLHILRDMYDELLSSPHLHYVYEQMKKILEEKYARSFDTPKHFAKVKWFAKYWNANVPDEVSTLRIAGVGL
jgi:hypothetical protein